MAQVLIGEVVSNKMDKSAVIAVTRMKAHPLYSKKYKVTKRYIVADPQNELVEGETVEITETRPMSSRKRWVVTKRLSKKGPEA